MAVGFIVIPLGEEGTGAEELRELASELQSALRVESPMATFFFGGTVASHWLDHPTVVEFVAKHLQSKGHSYPNCEACP